MYLRVQLVQYEINNSPVPRAFIRNNSSQSHLALTISTILPAFYFHCFIINNQLYRRFSNCIFKFVLKLNESTKNFRATKERLK